MACIASGQQALVTKLAASTANAEDAPKAAAKAAPIAGPARL
ncbi:MAG: hypothetical protein WCF24_01840 [Acidimicrobiales bacterium]